MDSRPLLPWGLWAGLGLTGSCSPRSSGPRPSATGQGSHPQQGILAHSPHPCPVVSPCVSGSWSPRSSCEPS